MRPGSPLHRMRKCEQHAVKRPNVRMAEFHTEVGGSEIHS